ncbi:MAG TPA: DUF4168 domain-containing protein [Gracilimonas sp.]|uniref:DUF4168 domain-containing protein n=1 Tax=Gracilimonas sp. TaxID=1974203 RepID=UPI002D92B0F3|nr:DUF4168 domain-containing protein [Gracilimonas sp.]
MLKYILSLTIALSMLACGSDQETQEPEQNSGDQQTQQFQPDQSAPDIEVSDDELEKFTEVTMIAQQIQSDSQQEMLVVVEEEELDVQTYNIIAESRFNEQSDDQLDVSAEDIEKFESASKKVEEIQQEVEAEMTAAIEAEGMEMDRYMEINMALQQDQALQQRVQQMMMQNMQQMQQQSQGEQPDQ